MDTQRRMQTCLLAIVALTFVQVIPKNGIAQQLAGAVVGAVTHPSKEAVPEAALKVRNVATGVVSTARTGATGRYEAAGLLPGTYEIAVKATRSGTSRPPAAWRAAAAPCKSVFVLAAQIAKQSQQEVICCSFKCDEC